MPAKSPPIGPNLSKELRSLGEQIQVRRKSIKASAIATSEAAGISRMTLNRIERGELSVAMSAYLNVADVLGLKLMLVEKNRETKKTNKIKLHKDTMINLKDYSQLKKLAWQINKTQKINIKDALNLYERNWRHIDVENLDINEKNLIESLLEFFGKGRMLV